AIIFPQLDALGAQRGKKTPPSFAGRGSRMNDEQYERLLEEVPVTCVGEFDDVEALGGGCDGDVAGGSAGGIEGKSFGSAVAEDNVADGISLAGAGLAVERVDGTAKVCRVEFHVSFAKFLRKGGGVDIANIEEAGGCTAGGD